jgi:hypothetical protein
VQNFGAKKVNKINHFIKFCSISDPLPGQRSAVERDRNWTVVAPGDTAPLSFEGINSSSVLITVKLQIFVFV